jgi:hypothetical protein
MDSLTMATQGRGESKPARKRQLNVIYFVDSSRTRSFKIPLGRLNALIVLFIGLCVWSVASVYIFVELVGDRQEIAGRLVTSSSTIFEYESQYDRAYDVAYPNMVKDPKAVSTAAAAEDAGDPDPEEEDAELKAATAAGAQKVNATASVENKKNKKSLSVEVENPVIEETATDLKLVFKVSNTGNMKANGFVWAIAEFFPDKGPVQYLAAPQGILLDSKGIAQKPSGGYRFSIRRFKVKRFKFPIPQGVAGSFKSIRIELIGYKSNSPSVFKIPVDIRIDSESAQGGGTEKTGKSG